MLKKLLKMALLLTLVLVAARTAGMIGKSSGQNLSRFCPEKGPCFHYDFSTQGQILIAYLSPHHVSSFMPWVEYWNEEKRFGAIFLISYDGSHLDIWHDAIAKSKTKNIYCLKNFDSSPYGLYPMSQAPALYILEEEGTSQGPFYKFNNLSREFRTS